MSYKIGLIGYCWNTSCPVYNVKTDVGVALSWMGDYRWKRWRCNICLANLRKFEL